MPKLLVCMLILQICLIGQIYGSAVTVQTKKDQAAQLVVQKGAEDIDPEPHHVTTSTVEPPPTNSSTILPPTTTNKTTISPPTNKTTTPITTTTTTTPHPTNASTTTKPTITPPTSPKSTSTTHEPTTPTTAHTTAKPPAHDRHFDIYSFIGGFSLAVGLGAIAFLGFKYYQSKHQTTYRTL